LPSNSFSFCSRTENLDVLNQITKRTAVHGRGEREMLDWTEEAATNFETLVCSSPFSSFISS
jgi:hypothetical protein